MSSMQERSEAGRRVYFQFIRLGPSGCGGRFWTEQIQVFIEPSGAKVSQFSLVFTMNPCKVTSSPLPHFASEFCVSISCIVSLHLVSAISIIIKKQFASQILLYIFEVLLQAFFNHIFPGKTPGSVVITISQMLPPFSDTQRNEVTCSMLQEKSVSEVGLKFRSVSHLLPGWWSQFFLFLFENQAGGKKLKS